MGDTLTRLTCALHAELCRLHDVQPEGYSMCGDFAALRDDAEKLAAIAHAVFADELAAARLAVEGADYARELAQQRERDARKEVAGE